MAVTVSKSVAENWLHLDRELGTYVWGFIHNSLVEKSLMSSILFYPQNNANQQTYQRIRPKDINAFTTTFAIIFLIRYCDFFLIHFVRR